MTAVSQQHSSQCITIASIGLRLLHWVMPTVFGAYGPDVLVSVADDILMTFS